MTRQFISSFMAVSGLPYASVVMGCLNSRLEADTILYFFIYYGRFPSEAEEEMLFHIGFYNYQAMLDRGVAASL